LTAKIIKAQIAKLLTAKIIKAQIAKLFIAKIIKAQIAKLFIAKIIKTQNRKIIKTQNCKIISQKYHSLLKLSKNKSQIYSSKNIIHHPNQYLFFYNPVNNRLNILTII